MLVAGYRSSCFIAFCPGRNVLNRRATIRSVVRAAQKDDHPANQQPEFVRDSNAWDEHLSSQDTRADKYRPPSYERQDMQASRGKFLGRLAVLILGVS